MVLCSPVYSQQSSLLDQQIAHAQTAFDQKDYTAAISLWQLALDEVRKTGDKQRLAELEYKLGVAYFNSGDTAKALDSFKEALTIYRELNNRLGEANQLANIGIVEMRLLRNDEALSSFNEALAIHRDLKDQHDEANDLDYIGNIERNLRRYDDALISFQRMLGLSRELKDRLGEGNALGNIGNVELALGRHEDALNSDRQALAIFREVNNRLREGAALSAIGGIEILLGRYDDSLRSTERALAIHRESKNRSGAAGNLNDIGVAERLLGRYDDARSSSRLALAIYREVKDPLGEAKALGNLGDNELGLGHYDEALSLYEQALAITQRNKYRLGIATALGNIGKLELRLGRYDDALRSNQDALLIFRELKNRLGEASVLGNIGTLEKLLGRSEDALHSNQRVLTIERELKNRLGEATALNSIGNAQGSLGRYGDALRSHQMALMIDREIKNLRGEAGDLVNIGRQNLYLGRYDDALRFARDGIAIDRQLANAEDLWRGLLTAASAETHLNRRDAAIVDYDSALNQIEGLRVGLVQTERASFFSNKLFVYDEYIAYLQELNRRFPGKKYDRKALDVLERKEARAALEEIARSAARRFQGVAPEVIAEDETTQAAVESAQQRLAKELGAGVTDVATRAALTSARAQRKVFEKGLRRNHPSYYALLHPKPVTAGELQHLLSTDEVLLSYHVVGDKSVLFVVTRSSLEIVQLQGEAALTRAAKRVRSHIDDMVARLTSATTSPAKLERDAAADLPKFAADSHALYRQVLPQVVDPLVEKKQLIIVPSGPLYNIAWESLVTRRSGKTLHYLFEDHAISYIPSGSFLAVVRKTNHKNRQRSPLLAFANPAFGDAAAGNDKSGEAYADLLYNALRDAGGGHFPDLPGTLDEARGVRNVLHAPAESIITGEDATKARLFSLNDSHRLATYRYLLFATHAVLTHEVKGVDQPALVFAHPDRGGFVTMADVFGLTLDANFVALSACNTGKGAGNPGEGIGGLTRAFIYAGTPAISVTLWRVDDKAAPQITPVFFAAMSAGASPADALRRAKLKMLHSSQARFRHPYAWSPSVIYGDGDSARR
jgi:tetratricopeptide (TPR) repeat protein